MRRAFSPFSIRNFLPLLMPLFGLFGCSASQPPASPAAATAPVATVAPTVPVATAAAREQQIYPVMLGIDTLEAEGFAAVKGKRIGLLTHPAGVNRRGV